MNHLQKSVLKKIASILLAALLLIVSGAPVAFAAETAAPAHTLQQTQALALVTENALADMQALQASTKSPWIQEMLVNASIADSTVGQPNKSGAIAVELTVTYPLLTSGVDAKTPFSGSDPEAFLRAALDNAMNETGSYALQATVTFREGRDPAFKWHSSKGFSGFRTALNTRAKAAATSFSSKPMVAALSAFVFGHPVRGAKLDVTGGLRAMHLRAVAPPTNRMLRIATTNALTRVAYEAQGPNTDSDTLKALLNEEIAKYGATFAKAEKAKTDQTVALTFDPLALIEERALAVNTEAEAYRSEYDSDYAIYSLGLSYRTWMLPDLPALPMPKTEQLRGVRRGVQISVRAKKGDGNRMISFEKDGELQSLCFIRDGERVTIYIPAGTYTIKMGSGTIWYGEDELFGPDIAGIASYSTVVDRFTNPGEGKYWQFTLSSPETGGNMDAMDRDDFSF